MSLDDCWGHHLGLYGHHRIGHVEVNHIVLHFIALTEFGETISKTNIQTGDMRITPQLSSGLRGAAKQPLHGHTAVY